MKRANHSPVTKDFMLLNSTLDSNGCWNWERRLRRNGYGSLSVNYKNISAHRMAYEVFVGRIPDSLCVCHKCDNRRCINPDHLFLGTRKDNMQDCKAKGRLSTKKFFGPRLVDREQAIAIGNLNLHVDKVAEQYGVSRNTIYNWRKLAKSEERGRRRHHHH